MVECDFCGMSRDKEHGCLVEVSSHWSFPDKLKWMCDECLIKKGLKEGDK